MRNNLMCSHTNTLSMERKKRYNIGMYVMVEKQKMKRQGRAGQPRNKNAKLQWNYRVVKLRERDAMDDHPAIILSRGRRERKDLVCSSSSSVAPSQPALFANSNITYASIANSDKEKGSLTMSCCRFN